MRAVSTDAVNQLLVRCVDGEEPACPAGDARPGGVLVAAAVFRADGADSGRSIPRGFSRANAEAWHDLFNSKALDDVLLDYRAVFLDAPTV